MYQRAARSIEKHRRVPKSRNIKEKQRVGTEQIIPKSMKQIILKSMKA